VSFPASFPFPAVVFSTSPHIRYCPCSNSYYSLSIIFVFNKTRRLITRDIIDIKSYMFKSLL
ncbi:hypothetical protein L9F63_004604, partial [Diploptera punctata]